LANDLSSGLESSDFKIKVSSNLKSNSCGSPVMKKVSVVVVALSIEILIALGNVTISEGKCVTSNNNNNDDDSSISVYSNISVSSGGVDGGVAVEAAVMV
jgi:hypothetical protein